MNAAGCTGRAGAEGGTGLEMAAGGGTAAGEAGEAQPRGAVAGPGDRCTQEGPEEHPWPVGFHSGCTCCQQVRFLKLAFCDLLLSETPSDAVPVIWQNFSASYSS